MSLSSPSPSCVTVASKITSTVFLPGYSLKAVPKYLYIDIKCRLFFSSPAESRAYCVADGNGTCCSDSGVDASVGQTAEGD